MRVRLRIRRLESLGDVDCASRSVQGELVGKLDVDVTVCRLGELRELGRLRALHRPDLGVESSSVKGDSTIGAAFVNAAHDLRIAAQILEDATCVKALGAEREMEVGSRAEA